MCEFASLFGQLFGTFQCFCWFLFKKEWSLFLTVYHFPSRHKLLTNSRLSLKNHHCTAFRLLLIHQWATRSLGQYKNQYQPLCCQTSCASSKAWSHLHIAGNSSKTPVCLLAHGSHWCRLASESHQTCQMAQRVIPNTCVASEKGNGTERNTKNVASAIMATVAFLSLREMIYDWEKGRFFSFRSVDLHAVVVIFGIKIYQINHVLTNRIFFFIVSPNPSSI